MTLRITPLNLAIFALVCTLAAAGVIPSVIAQGEDITSLDEEENLADGIISDVLDDGDADAEIDDTGADQEARDIADIDHEETVEDVTRINAARFAAQTSHQEDTNLKVDVIEEVTPPPTQPPGTPGTPPPSPPDGVFCVIYELVIGPVQTVCFSTQGECQGFSQAIVGLPNIGPIVQECQRFEESPPGATCARFEGTVPVLAISCEAL